MAMILKVGIVGTLPNNEVWSVNPIWRIDGASSASWDDLNTLGTALSAVTVPPALRSAWTGLTVFTSFKLEARTLAGGLINQLEKPRTSAVTGSGTGVLPLQTSMVTSLRTTSSGASARGRLYWPATGLALNSGTNRFQTADVAAVLGAVKTYLSGLETAIIAQFGLAELVVWSRKLSSTSHVNRLLAGDVPDVQRRRRDAAIEAYSTSNYP